MVAWLNLICYYSERCCFSEGKGFEIGDDIETTVADCTKVDFLMNDR